MNIGDKIRQVRKMRQLTQRGLAELLSDGDYKVGQNTISDYEQGKFEPVYTFLVRLINKLHISPLALFSALPVADFAKIHRSHMAELIALNDAVRDRRDVEELLTLNSRLLAQVIDLREKQAVVMENINALQGKIGGDDPAL